MLSDHLKPNRVVLALFVPGIAFLLLELILEPAAVQAALPALFIWAILYYLATATAVALRRRGARPPRFRRLLGYALFLIVLDQACKLLVLQLLPLGWKQPLIPGALTLSHVHNLEGSWLAVQFNLDFIGESLLIAVSVVGIVLTLSLYRYYVDRQGQPTPWAGIALIGFAAGLGSALVDQALRGLTVDYLGVAGLVVADLKDFYIDVAIAALFAEIAENWRAAREMSTRETIIHLQRALALSVRELAGKLGTWLDRDRSGPTR